MSKYRIFVSANQRELKEERFAVKDIITSSQTLKELFDVFLFEDLPAKGKPPASTYLKQVDNSDIYIGIIGNEYGIKGKDGISATEREFRHFIKPKRQRESIIFIKGRDDSKRDKDTQRFIKMVKDSFVYKRFTNTDELKSQVLNSLISYLDDKRILNRTPFDQTLRHEAEYKTIAENEVKDFLENRAVKLKVDVPKISIKDFLIKTLKVVKEEDGKLKPTNACLLFFGKNPTEYIPQNEIRIARFRGVTRTEFIDSKEIKGPIYKMLDEVELFFKRNTRLASKVVEFKRVDIPEYPYEAIREAVINAIAHRDYTYRWSPIMFSIFDDRIEVSSPGSLLPGLNIRSLEGHHATRNKIICDIFHETKDMEKFGTGIGKMKRLLKEHGLSKPEFKEEGDFFVVKFYGPGDKILDLVPSIPKERQVDLRELGLNNRQIDALSLMVNEKKTFTISQYIRKFNVTDKTARMDIGGLISKNFIEKIGQTKGAYFRAKTELPK
ncbi:MAG: ATP-binding protein [Nitrospirota bacterium]